MDVINHVRLVAGSFNNAHISVSLSVLHFTVYYLMNGAPPLQVPVSFAFYMITYSSAADGVWLQPSYHKEGYQWDCLIHDRQIGCVSL